MNSFFALLDLL